MIVALPGYTNIVWGWKKLTIQLNSFVKPWYFIGENVCIYNVGIAMLNFAQIF